MSKKNDDLSQVAHLKILLCGGLAGTVAKTAIAPLDRVKILFQVHSPNFLKFQHSKAGVFPAMSSIYSQHGLKGLFKGHAVMILRIFPYASINFYSYEFFKRKFYNEESSTIWWKRLMVGSLAGIVAVTFTYPLDITRTRLAYGITSSDPKSISFKTVICGLLQEGDKKFHCRLFGMYQGFIPTIIGIVPYAGISYFTFEKLKMIYRKDQTIQNFEIPALTKLLMGMISGAIAQTASYPFDVLRRQNQVRRIAKHLKYESSNSSIKATVNFIYSKYGIKGFYSGLSINYIKVAPATGISFVVYEFLKKNFIQS